MKLKNYYFFIYIILIYGKDYIMYLENHLTIFLNKYPDKYNTFKMLVLISLYYISIVLNVDII